jgi:hypothetical protein
MNLPDRIKAFHGETTARLVGRPVALFRRKKLMALITPRGVGTQL